MSRESGILRYIFVAFLIVIGIVANYFHLPFLFGNDFIFGSIITFIIIRFYGMKWGLLAAILINIYTIRIWGHHYAAIVLTLEAIFVGFLSRRMKANNLPMLDLIYWLILGIPLVCLFYHVIYDLNWTMTTIIFLKQTVNGVFNALIANFAVLFITLRMKYHDRYILSFQELLFNIFILFILLPCLITVNYQGDTVKKQMVSDIESELRYKSSMVAFGVTRFIEENLTPIRKLSRMIEKNEVERNSEQLQRSLALIYKTNPVFHTLYVADKNGTAVAFYPESTTSGKATIGLNFEDREYYRMVKRYMKPYISSVFVTSIVVNRPVVTITSPIIDGGDFIGFVNGTLNLEVFNRIIKEDKISVHLIDSNRRVIYSNDPNYNILDHFETLPENLFEGEVEYKESTNKNERVDVRLEQSKYILKYSLDDGITWQLVAEANVGSFIKPVFVFYIKMLLITLLSIVLAFVLSLLISYRLMDPLKKLANVTSNLPAKIIKQKEIQWPGIKFTEFKKLMQNFSDMADVLGNVFIEMKENQAELEFIALYDQLTGLRNRTSFFKRLEKLVEGNESFALFYLDLDRFKFINDTLGHDVGDLLLKEVAKRLTNICDTKEGIARLSGDEFAILLPNLKNVGQAKKLAKKIIKEIVRPFIISENECVVTVSIGISLFPEDGDCADLLIKHADIAMYHAKDLGKNNYQLYSDEMNLELTRKMELEKDLRTAINERQFFLVYQPQINIHTEKVSGVEALIRWEHPTLGFIPPVNFISLAEETGLIIPIGEQVLKEACMQMKSWHIAGYPHMPISINISVRQFLHEKFMDKITEILETTGLAPEYLKLEITESIAMQSGKVIDDLKQLREIGIKIAIDDFGIGYSSLNYLKILPVDSIKLDKAFIDDVVKNNYDATIVESVIKVAKSLNLSVIAEGVEDKAQLSFLKEKGCDKVQGFIYSPPLSASEMEEYLRKHGDGSTASS